MMIFVSRQYVVSFRLEVLGEDYGLQIYARDIASKETADIGFFGGHGIESAFLDAGCLLNNLYASKPKQRLDIISILKEQWWQYRDNIYGLHSLGETRNFEAPLLSALESYTKIFSVEMACFFKGLDDVEMEILRNTMSGKIDSNDSYYSELLEAQAFFRLIRDIG